MISRILTMISRLRSNSELVIKFTQIIWYNLRTPSSNLLIAHRVPWPFKYSGDCPLWNPIYPRYSHPKDFIQWAFVMFRHLISSSEDAEAEAWITLQSPMDMSSTNPYHRGLVWFGHVWSLKMGDTYGHHMAQISFNSGNIWKKDGEGWYTTK